MSCNECDRYRAVLGEIHDLISHHLDIGRIGKQADYATEHGKLIAAAASARKIKLSTLSKEIGYGDDYIARICRGKLGLSRRAALLIGPALGLDLIPYVIGGPGRPAARRAEQLPFPSEQAVAS